MDRKFSIEDLNNLDLNDIGNWPVAAKSLVVVVFALLIAYLGYSFFVKDTIEQLERAD